MNEPTGKQADLLPCPFCGEPPEIDKTGQWHRVECVNQKCSIAPNSLSARSRKQAIDEWNTRPDQQKDRRLRELVARFKAWSKDNQPFPEMAGVGAAYLLAAVKLERILDGKE